jgi:hypothetical protein
MIITVGITCGYRALLISPHAVTDVSWSNHEISLDVSKEKSGQARLGSDEFPQRDGSARVKTHIMLGQAMAGDEP